MGCTLNTIINTKETPRALSHTYQPNQKSISEQVQNAGQKEKGFTIDVKEIGEASPILKKPLKRNYLLN